MSQSHHVGSVIASLQAKDSRAMKLGVPPRTLWSNDQDPALLVKLCLSQCHKLSRYVSFLSLGETVAISYTSCDPK